MLLNLIVVSSILSTTYNMIVFVLASFIEYYNIEVEDVDLLLELNFKVIHVTI